MRHVMALLWPMLALPAFGLGLVENPAAMNKSLIVGVSHGLPGINYDIETATEIATSPACKYQVTKLAEGQGTRSAIASHLTSVSRSTGMDGSLFFYYSGHGNEGNIWPQDGLMKITTIRQAIEDGRRDRGPLARLVLVFDSCHSGSLLDPMRSALPLWEIYDDSAVKSTRLAETVVDEFTAGNLAPYWQHLIVIASSRADETSMAGDNGSVFTVAMKKAFDESMTKGYKISDFIAKAQHYTEGHHPVARLVPDTLGDEPMLFMK